MNSGKCTIQARITGMLAHFERSATGLFSFTKQYETTFEQGIYGCAAAKPTKRARNALGADREILVVASTFLDQQQRTIRFLKQEIDSAEGRYESNVAIVIHLDKEGNSKLKNWGRDQGLSVLPILDPSTLASASDLERRLCSELFTHDPFDVTGPVSDDQNFYGRRDEAIDLARKLQKGQIRSCLGIRKVGKTSIINRIIGEIGRTYDCLCMMVDCSRDDVWGMDAATLMISLADSIEADCWSAEGYTTIVSSTHATDAKSARRRLEEAILSVERPLVLVFDEIDYITPGSPTSDRWKSEFNVFWRNVRAVYQECDRQDQRVSILVGGVSTFWFTAESICGVENASLAFIPEEYLSPMPEGATVAMIRRLGRIAGLQIDDRAAAAIASATGNMPYWTRKCCSYIHRQIPVESRPHHLQSDQVSPLIDRFVAEEGGSIAEIALRHLFRVHPLLQDATRSCYEGAADQVPLPRRRILQRYGVLSANNELSGAMMREAFEALLALSSQDRRESSSSPHFAETESSLFGEWAEELATIGKRRNLLEKRLRNVVVNFIRFDSLSSGKSADIKWRLAKILPEKRRSKLLHLSAEDLVGKFNWSDLANLMTKEWSLFERLFGSKDSFKQHADIINDRFDAHAKDADVADLALYRRSLKYLEDRLASLQ